MGRPPITPIDRERIINLYRFGNSIQSICRQLNIGYGTVYRTIQAAILRHEVEKQPFGFDFILPSQIAPMDHVLGCFINETSGKVTIRVDSAIKLFKKIWEDMDHEHDIHHKKLQGLH